MFVDFAEEYLAWHKHEYPASHDRINGICRNYFIPLFGTSPLGSIGQKELERYKTLRRPHAKTATIKKEMRTLQAILNKAVQWEQIPRNRARGVKPPQELDARPARYFSREELERLYEHNPAKRAIWKLMANTGLRRAEALNLRWDDTKEGVLYVVSTPSARSKSKRYRIIPLNAAARGALEGLANSSHHVLPRMVPWSLSRAFGHDARRAGLATGTLHALRHTFCSHLVMNGADLKTVQELAGHSTIVVTMQYAHLSQEHQRSAVTLLDL